MKDAGPAMAEQKRQRTRIEAIRRIFKWIGVGLAAVLLILAVILQVPWKAITLSTVCLAVWAMLPERSRKWFWLSAAAVLAAIVIWIFLPDGDGVWAPFTLAQELAAHEAKYAIPQEQNAAIIYDKLLHGYVPNEWRMRFLPREVYDKALSRPWLSRDYPVLAQWLDKHRDIVTTLPQACRIRTCRFASDFQISRSDESQIYRYAALKSWALALLLSGNNDVAEGRPDEGFQKYICALQIAGHLYQQKRAHDFLIGFGIEGITLPRINRYLIEGNMSDKQLQLVIDTLGNLEDNWSSDFLQCFEYDRLFVKNTFCSLVYQRDAKGHVRLSRDPAAAIAGFPRPKTPAEAYWQRKSMKASALFAWFFVPATPDQATELIDAVFEPYRAMADPNFAWERKDAARSGSYSLNCYFLVWSLIKRTTLQYDGFHSIYPKRLLQRRGTRVLIALKEYYIDNGRWPASLDAVRTGVPIEALIDPQNDGSFVYECEGESFTLYSKGKNGADNDGHRSIPPAGDSIGPEEAEDDVLFWPPRLPETEIMDLNPLPAND